MFLQILVEVLAELRAEDPDHLVLAHLAQGGAVHGTIGETQGTRVKLGALHMVTDPVQHVVCCPGLWARLPVPLTCRDSGRR